ncbi:YhcH/YjgK/YiaL family protein [Sediminibacterium ginsengisoli]|uniref:YhcH/YjgK/YiaL family protein n=1 Tax=Sediminibacterium ginsengisoli TaxID=413434 RepID=A0A1T4RX35_9BACT|nr:YhcH/YjgK/YiaL family protein [Sediminibacterium ginsengisoli]SKA20564.1 YhcH/YjgK/YiaL family protein [Sediminibacterium ginsengisoli]
MIIDDIAYASRYYTLGSRIRQALVFLQETDFAAIPTGKHEVDGENIIAIVDEYDTKDAASEQLESHKTYIDIQYLLAGEELIGHLLLQDQLPSVPYNAETDEMIFAERPAFFSKLQPFMFAILYPTDLHMPGIISGTPTRVKKVVMKVKAD